MISAENKPAVKVSIVLPTFNQSKYLLAAIQTLVNQTFQDFELIIVNDGSTDETAAILASIQHPKIHIITQPNQGLPSALNNGFATAKGEYWTWTSTDNIASPVWLEELVKALDNSPPDIHYAFSYYAVIDEQDNILYVNQDQRFDLPTLLMRHTGNASFLYRAAFAKKIGPYDTQLMYAEDLDMWVRMSSETAAIHVESVLYYYRSHQQSMTTQQEKVKLATKGLVTKFLAQYDNKFNIENLFPCISLSNHSTLEKWKARIRLVTLGANATFYCPVTALIDQLMQALQEKYEAGLIGNMVHLLAKENHWETAARIVSHYKQTDNSAFLVQLVDIIARQSTADLQKIPFLTLEEKWLATDCKDAASRKNVLRNIYTNLDLKEKKSPTFERVVTDLINQLEDLQDHPDVWGNIASLESPEEKNSLMALRSYISELTTLPQEPQTLLLLKILEAVCQAYTNQVNIAKITLQSLNKQFPNTAVIMGALLHLYLDETLQHSVEPVNSL